MGKLGKEVTYWVTVPPFITYRMPDGSDLKPEICYTSLIWIKNQTSFPGKMRRTG